MQKMLKNLNQLAATGVNYNAANAAVRAVCEVRKSEQ